MCIKTGLFFLMAFFCIITPISGIINHYCIIENVKENWEKIRTNLEQYTLKIMKISKTASLRSNFTASYKKIVQRYEKKSE